MDRKVFWALVAFTFALLFSFLLVKIVAPFGPALIWGAVIGIATFPLYERVRLRFRGRENMSSAVMTFFVFLVFILPMGGIVALLAGEAADVYRVLESATKSRQIPGFETVRSNPTLGSWITGVESFLAGFGIDVEAELLPAAKYAVSSLFGFAGGILKNILFSIINIILVLILLFFIYRDGEKFQDEFWSVIPLSDENKRALKENVSRVLTGCIVGIVGTGLIQGVLGGIGFWISGLPSPIVFGSLMAFSALIPFVGTALFWIPGGIYLLIAGKVAKGIFLLAWGVFVVSTVDNIVRPLLIGGKAALPFSLMAIGAIGGFAVFGLVGVIIGPVAVSLVLVLFSMYKARTHPPDEQPPTSEEPGGKGGIPADRPV
jgi:predicted PurR-regulated permease PerM